MTHPLLAAAALALAVALSTCSGQPPTTTTTTTTTTASASTSGAAGPSTGATSGAPSTATASTTTPVPSSPSAQPTYVDAIVLAEPAASAPAWRLAFELPYGDAPGRLGTSLGGDGAGIRWGPSYGVQVGDGTWWFLDNAHRRLAHYSAAGAYLDEVTLPASVLQQGEYVQWAHPVALDDGTVVLTSTSVDAPGLLLLRPDRSLRKVTQSREAAAAYSDGKALFGFDPEGAPVRIDPGSGAVTPAAAFVTRDGRPFVLTVGAGSLTIEYGGGTRTLPVRAAAYPGQTVHPSLQAASGCDGALWVLVLGIVEPASGDARDVAGLVRIDASRRVEAPLAVPKTSSASDPADGSHVGVRAGDAAPWLMFVDVDALRVYRPA